MNKPLTPTMAAAITWRLDMAAARSFLTACYRCKGFGLVWWCGKPGEGGRRGPCPRCQRQGADRFVSALARETFGGRSAA